MFYLYNILVYVAQFTVKIISFFSPKIKLFVDGRKKVFDILSTNISSFDKTIWFHAASLGEYEQGLPVMEKIKEKFPNHKIILTFFSPSGYEVRKNNQIADITIYLPLDTKTNAKRFVEIVHPEKVFFIKYEYWMNYLNELKINNIPTYLISGIFRENQAFFKWYGGFYRYALKSFSYFFVQNDTSKILLNKLGFYNCIVSGDTRFDRVSAILKKDNHLTFIEKFKTTINNDDSLIIVIGSSWPKDEELLISYINKTNQNVKFIIAPHNIKQDQIINLKKQFKKKVVLFSEMEEKSLADYNVFIIDTIGLLTKIYSYADIAYVGGGFGNPGVHNILEPATFGIPVVIGPNYSHFAEAVALVNQQGCITIKNKFELEQTFDLLLQNQDERLEKGLICKTFINMNEGATAKILKLI